MLIDTHCHLDFPEFDPDRDQIVAHALESGLKYIINVASSVEGSRRGVDLAAIYERVYATVGIHPHEADSVQQSDIARIDSLAAGKKVVAVGEVGLDYYRNLAEIHNQKSIFRAQIGIAVARGLPLVVHSRQAQADTLEILKGYDLPKVLIHCFSGDGAFLDECLSRGYFCSFTCNITYKKADDLRGYLKRVPLDRLMLETDAPYLSPEGLRGRRNEPALVMRAAETAAVIKGIDLREICAVTTRNAESFFALPAAAGESL